MDQSYKRRKSHWLTRKWNVSSKGNPFLELDGMHMVVFRNKDGKWAWKIGKSNNKNAIFSKTAWDKVDHARLALFDEYWGQLQHRQSLDLKTRDPNRGVS